MNCANHADASAVAYCRTCGKALCANCTRPVRGVIYCEDCLGAKMEGVPAGTAGFVPGTFTAGTAGPLPPVPQFLRRLRESAAGPNPALAGILGFFPGVGAVYNGQYAKGLAHLTIFVLLVLGGKHQRQRARRSSGHYLRLWACILHYLSDFRCGAFSESDPDVRTGAGSIWTRGNVRRRSKNRDQQNSNRRDCPHFGGRDLSPRHSRLVRIWAGPFLAIDFDCVGAAGCSRATGACWGRQAVQAASAIAAVCGGSWVRRCFSPSVVCSCCRTCMWGRALAAPGR